MRFRGLKVEHTWRIAFWLFLVVSAAAAAGHGIIG
jgi:hypothetical protein